MWVGEKTNAKCDAGAGEVYLDWSPGKKLKPPGIASCKESCENDEKCQSITLFQSGWCSHFSTPCAKTKKANKAVSWTLSKSPGLPTNETPCTLALCTSTLATPKHAHKRAPQILTQMPNACSLLHRSVQAEIQRGTPKSCRRLHRRRQLRQDSARPDRRVGRVPSHRHKPLVRR